VDRERLATWARRALVAIFIVQLVGLLIIFTGEGRDETPPSSQGQGPGAREPTSKPPETEKSDKSKSAKEGAQPDFPGSAHVNEQLGYRFRRPVGWDVDWEGTVTELTSSDEKTKVTFGLAPAGNLRSASSRTVSVIQDQYGDVLVTRSASTHVGSRPARLVEGKATNDTGVRLLFHSITVAGPDDNYAILAFSSIEETDGQAQPPIEEIIDTFRVTSPAKSSEVS
jgi:hypothetical protein